ASDPMHYCGQFSMIQTLTSRIENPGLSQAVARHLTLPRPAGSGGTAPTYGRQRPEPPSVAINLAPALAGAAPCAGSSSAAPGRGSAGTPRGNSAALYREHPLTPQHGTVTDNAVPH